METDSSQASALFIVGGSKYFKSDFTLALLVNGTWHLSGSRILFYTFVFKVLLQGPAKSNLKPELQWHIVWSSSHLWEGVLDNQYQKTWDILTKNTLYSPSNVARFSFRLIRQPKKQHLVNLVCGLLSQERFSLVLRGIDNQSHIPLEFLWSFCQV